MTILLALTLAPLLALAYQAQAAPGVAFTLDPVTVAQLVLSTVLPLLVGLVTKVVTHSGVRAVLLAAFALVASLLAELIRAWQQGDVYDLGAGLLLALPSFIIGVAMHYGIWAPTGVAKAAQQALGGDPHPTV